MAEIRKSISKSSSPSSSKCTARPPTSAAKWLARCHVRLATHTSAKPISERIRAPVCPTSPVPSISARRPERSPKSCCSSPTAASQTEEIFSVPTEVLDRTRFPVCSACRNRRFRSGPAAASRCADSQARFTCP